MSEITLHFHDRLQVFLPRYRHGPYCIPLDRRTSVKDLLESQGVPHPEIGLILIEGISVGFEALVQPGDQIEVYPFFDALDLPEKIALRPPPPQPPRFVLDIHLGRLAATLRMLGFDTIWRNDIHDEELAELAGADQRVLLTRDVGCLKRSRVVWGYFVRSPGTQDRNREVIREFDLARQIRLFERCMKCNGMLEAVSKSEIADRLPEGTAQVYEEFHRCAVCEQIYWRGPHVRRMERVIADLLA